jgi:transposase-like protein
MSVIRKTYTVEFKIKVVREILREEKTLAQIASEYGIHTNVIARWRDPALADLAGAFNDQTAAMQATALAARAQRTRGVIRRDWEVEYTTGLDEKKGGHLFEAR